MRALLLALAASALVVSSCSTESKPDDGGNDTKEPPPGSVVEDADAITFYTPEFEVPPGDSFTCVYLDYSTKEELTIIGGDGIQGKGGHHIIAYYANSPREVGLHTCEDAEMVNLNQISGSAGDGGQVLKLPEGIALKVPAGKQIVLQAHYINTSGETYKTRDWASIAKGDPAKVTAYANYFVTDDEAWEIAPNSPTKHTSVCKLDRDFQVALDLPHMHEFGKHFTMEVLDENDNVIDTPIDTDWQPLYTSHPPINAYTVGEPYMLKKGQKLRQTCEWQNSTSDPMVFPREMCVGFFYYWPGDGDLDCDMQPVEGQD